MSDTGNGPQVEPIDPPDDTNPRPADADNPEPNAGDFSLIDPPDDTGGGKKS